MEYSKYVGHREMSKSMYHTHRGKRKSSSTGLTQIKGRHTNTDTRSTQNTKKTSPEEKRLMTYDSKNTKCTEKMNTESCKRKTNNKALYKEKKHQNYS